MMLAKSILANFILGLNLNISIILYGLVSESLDKVIRKAKIIEIGQKNALRVV